MASPYIRVLHLGRSLTVLACAIFVPTLSAAQPSAVLTPSDMRAAITWGSSGAPSPYVLHNQQRRGEVNGGVLALIYTPFVRVALAAKTAHDNYREFTPDDITEDLVKPVAYIAYRWYCCDGDHGADMEHWHPLSPFDYKIGVPGDLVATAEKRMFIKPLWVRRDVVELLKQFGTTPLYDDIVLVAAYPMPALAVGTEFAIYRELSGRSHSGQPEYLTSIGTITAADVVRWR
jgi:hypothetical protein